MALTTEIVTESPTTYFRPDFRNYPVWSYAEAAVDVVVSVKTIQAYVCKYSERLRVNTIGPLRVNAIEFKKFKTESKAQRDAWKPSR